MDYRDEYERGRRYRGEGDFRVSDRRGWDRPDWERRDYERGRRDEPGFVERFIDELRSWFSDEDVRRRGGDREPRGWGGGERGWGGRADEEGDRGWARQWGYVDRADARGRSSWPQRPSESSWGRERGYVDEGYGREREEGSRYYEPPWWGDPSAWGPERGAQWSERGRSASGPHAGRGPRGYQRSDERIREDICDVLCQHGYVDASDIEVTVLNGEVTLVGTVRERPEKRIAEDAAEQVSGVREVHNQLRVTQGGSGQEPHDRPGDPRFRVA